MTLQLHGNEMGKQASSGKMLFCWLGPRMAVSRICGEFGQNGHRDSAIAKQFGKCPLWVRSGHSSPVGLMSALRQ